MRGFIRYHSIFQLFNNFEVSNPIIVEADDTIVELQRNFHDETFYFTIEPNEVREKRLESLPEDYYSPNIYEPFEDYTDMYVNTYGKDYENSVPSINLINQTRNVSIDKSGKIINQKIYGHNRSPIKKYEYQPQSGRKGSYSFFIPPHGGNFIPLYAVIRNCERKYNIF
jgi:hypothetical protein